MCGIDRGRYAGAADDRELDEYICAICLAIYVNPMVTQCCRQTYCYSCIDQWLTSYNTCPNDRGPLYMNEMLPAPRIVHNLLANMPVRCEYYGNGCSSVVKVCQLAHHLLYECQYIEKCGICGYDRNGVNTGHNCNAILRGQCERLTAENQCLIDRNGVLFMDSQRHRVLMEGMASEIQRLNELNAQLAYDLEALRRDRPNINYMDESMNNSHNTGAQSEPDVYEVNNSLDSLLDLDYNTGAHTDPVDYSLDNQPPASLLDWDYDDDTNDTIMAIDGNDNDNQNTNPPNNTLNQPDNRILPDPIIALDNRQPARDAIPERFDTDDYIHYRLDEVIGNECDDNEDVFGEKGNRRLGRVFRRTINVLLFRDRWPRLRRSQSYDIN